MQRILAHILCRKQVVFCNQTRLCRLHPLPFLVPMKKSDVPNKSNGTRTRRKHVSIFVGLVLLTLGATLAMSSENRQIVCLHVASIASIMHRSDGMSGDSRIRSEEMANADRRYASPAIDSVKIGAKALQFLVFNTSLSIDEKSKLMPIANVSDPQVTAVYNPAALQRLVELKDKVKKGKTITLVMNGGSSSAHVPDGDRKDLYYRRFVDQFLKPELNATIKVVDRAHGSRNSAHSAHLISSFFPNHTDIVIWEFSINDGHSAKDVKNAFILWLRNVAARQKTPPLVILLYLWKSPFDHDEKGKIKCRTFDQHQMIGAEYDFVLGHVNMAAYFDSLQWGLTEQPSITAGHAFSRRPKEH